MMASQQEISEDVRAMDEAMDKVVDEGDGGVGPDRLVYLLPEEIVIPEVLDVRPWSTRAGNTEAEVEAIEQLAKTIQDEGQIQPVKVRYGDRNVGLPDGLAYELVVGRRRVQAVSLINAGKKAGEAPLRVKAVVGVEELNDPHAFRQAVIENVHRVGVSPMDMAEDIRVLMGKFGWHKKGENGVKKLAEYLHVSPATVTQHLRLLKLAPEVQAQVHRGEITKDAAFAVAVVEPDKQVEVVKKAGELQAQEAEKVGATSATKRKTGTVKARHVKQAVREAAPESTKPQSRTKKEIAEWFDAMEGPTYGYPDGAVHGFVREFRAWVSGGSRTDRKLQSAWDAMVGRAPKGTKASLKADGK